VKPALLLATAALLLAAGCGGGSAELTSAPPAVAKELMTKRLEAQRLNYRWVACVRVPRRYTDVPITRCNVNFGIDPHVEAYCLVLEDGKPLTNHEEPAIPCSHDDAGWDKTTVVGS
jgi:hypothetical protein